MSDYISELAGNGVDILKDAFAVEFVKQLSEIDVKLQNPALFETEIKDLEVQKEILVKTQTSDSSQTWEIS